MISLVFCQSGFCLLPERFTRHFWAFHPSLWTEANMVYGRCLLIHQKTGASKWPFPGIYAARGFRLFCLGPPHDTRTHAPRPCAKNPTTKHTCQYPLGWIRSFCCLVHFRRSSDRKGRWLTRKCTRSHHAGDQATLQTAMWLVKSL